MRRGGFLALGVLAAGALAGCVLITGSTNGYVAADDGGGALVVDSGVCIAESGVCFELGCVRSTDCDSGMVCCLGAVAPVGLTCQASCPFGAVQVCGSDSECGDAGACIEQECAFLGSVDTVRFCGLVSSCTEVNSSAPTNVDAGTHDSGG